MEPDIAVKVAKLLRMLTSSFDGEVLATVNRINSLVATHNINWDEALAPGRSPVRADSSSYAGSAFERVRTILDAASRAETDGVLTLWEIRFCRSMRERIWRYDHRTFISDKQWNSISRLEDKLRRLGYI